MRHKRLTAWLGLCALVFLQLQIASHAEHGSFGSHDESCETCLKLDKSGDPPPTLTATSGIAPDAGSPALGPALNPSTRICRPHCARGPPVA